MALSHNRIWAAIDALALRLNTTPSGLARLASLDPTSFNKSKRASNENPPRPRWPSTESLSKLLQATGTSFGQFAQLAEDGGREGTDQGIPLIGFAEAGSDGYFDDAGFPLGQGWDQIDFPGVDHGLYALEISGDSMLPLYRDGDRIIVDPHNPNLRRGDRVVVKTNEGEVLVKELSRLSAKSVELRSLNPAFPDRQIERDHLTWIARVVWASQ